MILKRRAAGFLLVFLAVAGVSIRVAPGKELVYKKEARKGIALLADGRLDEAKAHFEAILERRPGDAESLFGLALLNGMMNESEAALDFVDQALLAGIPFGRFLAGPRDLLAPLARLEGFRELAESFDVALVHGPMLGNVTDRSARFWVRTARESDVQVVVRPSPGSTGSKGSSTRAGDDSSKGSSEPLLTGMERSRSSRDFTTVVSVTGLEPDREYSCVVKIDGRKEAGPSFFRTFPERGSGSRIRIGFGGGAGYTPWNERMWDTILARKPRAFLFLGDNVYIDNPTRPAVQEYCYSRRHSRPEFRRFIASTSIFAVWDDHDFVTDDKWGGPGISNPPWKVPVRRLFCCNWNNPAYGGGEARPGCWFSCSMGDVDCFMLDSRFYRTDPREENPTMLGPHQKRWLLDGLKASKAAFKILASPVPWAKGTKPGSRDTWDGYSGEREEIFSFIEANRICGVILISADRHRSDVWAIERPDGYTLHEFESSHLTNLHRHRAMDGALFSYNEKCAFGLLTIDTTLGDPEATYRIVNIDNEVVHTRTVKLGSLTFSETREGQRDG